MNMLPIELVLTRQITDGYILAFVIEITPGLGDTK